MRCNLDGMKFFLFTIAAVTTLINHTQKEHAVLAEQAQSVREDMQRIEEIRVMDMRRIEEIRVMDMRRIEEIRVMDTQLTAKDIQLAAAQLKVEQAEKLLLLAFHAGFNFQGVHEEVCGQQERRAKPQVEGEE